MGTLADSLFTVMMSWVRALVSGIWALFSSEHTTVLEFLGKNWIMIAVVLIAAGLVLDWLIWLVRWQPYHIWAQRVRRLLGVEDDDEYSVSEAQSAVGQTDFDRAEPEETFEEAYPSEDLFIDEREAQEAIDRANEVPDETLGAYPGKRYGVGSAQEELSGTRRFSALTAQGPGSEEVARRRAEIDAWQQQMQEEARARAEAERAARKAEQERLAREAAEAEAARLAEQERLAQEEYQRQLAQYEIEKAQYERELAEYERQKAAYEAQLAREQAAQEAAEEIVPQAAQDVSAQGAPRRRRAVSRVCEDAMAEEMIAHLPDPPAWPKAEQIERRKPAGVRKTPKPTEKPKREHKLLDRMAKMIEPEEKEIVSFTTLPPRVDMHDAYRTAKMPPISEPGKGRRKR